MGDEQVAPLSIEEILAANIGLGVSVVRHKPNQSPPFKRRFGMLERAPDYENRANFMVVYPTSEPRFCYVDIPPDADLPELPKYKPWGPWTLEYILLRPEFVTQMDADPMTGVIRIAEKLVAFHQPGLREKCPCNNVPTPWREIYTHDPDIFSNIGLVTDETDFDSFSSLLGGIWGFNLGYFEEQSRKIARKMQIGDYMGNNEILAANIGRPVLFNQHEVGGRSRTGTLYDLGVILKAPSYEDRAKHVLVFPTQMPSYGYVSQQEGNKGERHRVFTGALLRYHPILAELIMKMWVDDSRRLLSLGDSVVVKDCGIEGRDWSTIDAQMGALLPGGGVLCYPDDIACAREFLTAGGYNLDWFDAKALAIAKILEPLAYAMGATPLV